MDFKHFSARPGGVLTRWAAHAFGLVILAIGRALNPAIAAGPTQPF
jgi:hypothetical protein